jgi:membrane-associated phospholipid phosphatase/Na+/melibiose symporter-like transporter
VSSIGLRGASVRAAQSCRAFARAGTLALVAFAAAALAAGLGRAVVTTYLPVLLADIRDAPGLIGTVMLVNPIAGFAVPLVVGIWSDRVSGTRGRRLPFIAGGSLLTAGGLIAVALGTGSSYFALALAGGVAYVGLNAVTTAHRALIPDCFSPAERARATSAQEIAALIGGLAGIVVGGSLIEVHSWAPFALAGLAVPLVALPTLLSVREPEGVHAAPTETRAFGYYRRAAMRPGVRELLLAQILWVLGYAALPAFFVLYAEQVLELEPSIASLLLAGFGVATGGIMLAAGRVRNPDWQPPLLSLGVVLMGGGFISVALTDHLLWVAGALLMAAAGFGLVTTLGFPLFSSLIPPEEEGAYSALYFSGRAVASAIALPAAGWTVAVTGSYRALFVFGGIVALTALLPLLRGCSVSPLRAFRFSVPWPRREWWLRWAGSIALLYGALAAAVLLVVGTSLERVDASLFRVINNNLAPGPDLLWDALNPHTRNYVLLYVVGVAAALLARPRRVVQVFVLLTLSWVFSLALLEALHLTYNRPRPEEALGRADVVTSGAFWSHIASYPSGHMAITAALVTGIVYLFPRLRWPLWAYAAAVAFTRVMFGAHFPFDVIAGTVLGYVSARLAFALLAETRLIEPLRGGLERAGYDQRVLDEPVQVLEPAARGRFGHPPSPREAET